MLRVLRRYWSVWRREVGGEMRGIGKVIKWAPVQGKGDLNLGLICVAIYKCGAAE